MDNEKRIETKSSTSSAVLGDEHMVTVTDAIANTWYGGVRGNKQIGHHAPRMGCFFIVVHLIFMVMMLQ